VKDTIMIPVFYIGATSRFSSRPSSARSSASSARSEASVKSKDSARPAAIDIGAGLQGQGNNNANVYSGGLMQVQYVPYRLGNHGPYGFWRLQLLFFFYLLFYCGAWPSYFMDSLLRRRLFRAVGAGGFMRKVPSHIGVLK